MSKSSQAVAADVFSALTDSKLSSGEKLHEIIKELELNNIEFSIIPNMNAASTIDISEKEMAKALLLSDYIRIAFLSMEDLQRFDSFTMAVKQSRTKIQQLLNDQKTHTHIKLVGWFFERRSE